MKLKLAQLFAGGACAAACAVNLQTAQAQSADALIDKLVDKGILTVREAQDLREEADKGFNAAYAVKSGMPDWVTSLKFNGDLRGRFEGFYADNPAFVDRNRFRYRLRAGFTAVMMDKFEVGFRLTSSEAAAGGSGGDPISGNSTFTDNASKKLVYIDLAYARWTPVNNANWNAAFSLGKIENPFVFSEMVFDGDYTPEGFGQQLGYTLNEKHGLKLNLGEFFVEEVGGSSMDTYLVGAQLRLESVWSPKIATSLGFSGLAISGVDSLTSANVPNQNRGNTRLASGALTQDYNPWIADASFTYTLPEVPFYSAPFPIRVGAEYINNPGADANNEGYGFIVQFGKSGKKGLWDVSYRWKELQADAWYEELVDSDSGALYETAPVGGGTGYGAGTNIRGHVARATYSPYDSLTLSVTYFLLDAVQETPNASDSTMGRLQVDASWKF